MLLAISTELCYQIRTTHQPNKEDLPENIEWTEETETAYKMLKLKHELTFQLQIDASDVRIGAILSQEGNKINLLPILAGSY